MKTKLLIIICLTFIPFYLKAQFFDIVDRQYIKEMIDSTLKMLDKYGDFSDDEVTINPAYVDKFLNLFTNPDSCLIFNDLTRKPKFITPKQYVTLVQSQFPYGIVTSLQIDSLHAFYPIKIGPNTYKITVKLPRHTAGLSSSNQIFRTDYIAFVTFKFSYFFNGNFGFFKIDHISNLKTYRKNLSNKRSKGTYLCMSSYLSASQFLLSGTNIPDFYRTISNALSPSLQIAVKYMFNTFFGASIGLNFTKFNALERLNFSNNFKNNIYLTDKDGENYYLYIQSNILEKLEILMLQIPITLHLGTNYYDKTQFVFNLSLNPTYILSSHFIVNGTSSRAGYYPQYHVIVSDAPTYGFGIFKYQNALYPVQFNKILFSASIMPGLSVPLKKAHSYMEIYFFYSRSFSPLGYKKPAYNDDYISISHTTPNGALQNFGLLLNYSLKL